MPPAGFKRSRAVWDNARRPHASRVEALKSWSRAILYELQPVRGLVTGGNNNASPVVEVGKVMLHYTKVCGLKLHQFATTTIPIWSAVAYRFLQALTWRQWCMVAGVLLYYVAVRYIHHVLEAGPLMIITTALVAIFTVGLGDKDANGDHDGISAYSVFNRGFQRLMGSVDADQLLAQHVGGAMGMGFMGNGGGDGGGGDDDDGMVMGLQEPRRQRRVHNNHAEADPPRAAAAAAAAGDDEDQEDDNDENENNNRGGGGRARPPGKKARRRNLDQRRELRRQRDAAAAMGFGGGNANDEIEAMQRLLDDQVVAMNNNHEEEED